MVGAAVGVEITIFDAQQSSGTLGGEVRFVAKCGMKGRVAVHRSGFGDTYSSNFQSINSERTISYDRPIPELI